MSNHYISWTTSISLIGTSAARANLNALATGQWSTGTINLSSYVGAQLVLDFLSTSTAATCKDIEYEVFGGLTTAQIDDIALFAGSVSSSPNPSQVSMIITGVHYARVKLTMSSSNDSHECHAHYQRFNYKTT